MRPPHRFSVQMGIAQKIYSTGASQGVLYAAFKGLFSDFFESYEIIASFLRLLLVK